MAAQPPVTSPRRIAFVDQADDIGGAEQSLLELLPRLDRRRYQPLLLHTAGAHWTERAEISDVPHIPVLQPSPVLVAKRDELKPGVLASWDHLLASRRPVAALRRALVDQHADLVHTNALKSHLLGGFAATLARMPLVWHVRDILTERPARKWLLQTARSFKPYVIAISEAVAEQFEPVRDRVRLRVIHNGIPLDKFCPGPPSPELQAQLGLAPDDEVVLVVGRLTPWKGHQMLLEAMQSVLSQRPRARLLVAGTTTFWETTYSRELHEQAERLAVGGRVQWLGFRDDVPELLRLCDVFVLPSVNEPFGRALVEAMATSKPVIGTRSGGVPEVFTDGKCGLLVKPDHAADLAGAIVRILSDKPLARQMGECGWQRANRYFDIRRVAREVQEVYEEILGRGA
jgi:glycosyltransferase involved in cell wall biosynthesis